MPTKSPPAKVDPRVRRTRRALRGALISLILEKDYASISIKEVTERAETAYVTFYRHYDTLDQLLAEVLDEGLAELMTRIESLAKQSDTANLETEGRLIFEYIGQNADLFSILFKSQSVARVRKKVVRDVAVIFQHACMPLARLGNPVTLEITSNHIATSLFALVEWWLENGMTPPPAKMGKVYKSLIIDSTVGAAGSLSMVSG
ncbi:MAG: TetR/AcrR family transcriptional regulator [Chloroflexota bacterium]